MSQENLQNQNKEIQPQPNSQEVFQAGADFTQHFEVQVDPAKEPEKFQEALKQFDPRYQGDRDLVRYELEADQREWPEDTKQVIMQTAEAMRMLAHETPLEGHYDVVVALGGARQANLDRLRYLVDALQKDEASFDHIVAAGATRQLRDDEKANVANYAPNAETEMDLLEAAAKVIEDENPGLKVEVFGIEHEMPNGKKAGTPDVMDALFAKLQDEGAIHEGSRVGVVTTQIYQASTALDAERVGRKYGLATMAAGNPSDPEIMARRTPSTYLSEIIRTFRAATLAAQSEK